MKDNKVLCDVVSCKFHNNHECNAKTITVTCDKCVTPKETHETACKSFELKR